MNSSSYKVFGDALIHFISKIKIEIYIRKDSDITIDLLDQLPLMKLGYVKSPEHVVSILDIYYLLNKDSIDNNTNIIFNKSFNSDIPAANFFVSQAVDGVMTQKEAIEMGYKNACQNTFDTLLINTPSKYDFTNMFEVNLLDKKIRLCK